MDLLLSVIWGEASSIKECINLYYAQMWLQRYWDAPQNFDFAFSVESISFIPIFNNNSEHAIVVCILHFTNYLI